MSTKLPWLKLWVSDLETSPRYAAMTKSQRGCYLDLLLLSWRNADSGLGCGVASDLNIVFRQTSCFTELEQEDTRVVLEACFCPSDTTPNLLVNKRLVDVRNKQESNYEQNRGAALARWGKKKASAPADANADACADAYAVHSGSDSGSVSSSKSNSKKKKTVVPKLPQHLDTVPGRQALETWLAYKKEQRFTYKPIGLKSFLKTCGNNFTDGGEFLAAVELASANGWKGLVYDKKKTNGFPDKWEAKRQAEKTLYEKIMREEDE